MLESGQKIKQLDWNDMLAFVASMVWMDTRKLPTMREYFCKDDDLNDKFLCRLRDSTGFGGNKLSSVFKSCRLYDKKKCEETGRSVVGSETYDPQFKNREMVNEFTKSAQKFFNLGRHGSFDESMDLFTVCNVLKL